jgi:hypothetical protein
MSTSEPEPQSGWECDRRMLLRLPGGEEWIDCPRAKTGGRSCAARLLSTIRKPFRSLPNTARTKASSDEKTGRPSERKTRHDSSTR